MKAPIAAAVRSTRVFGRCAYECFYPDALMLPDHKFFKGRYHERWVKSKTRLARRLNPVFGWNENSGVLPFGGDDREAFYDGD